MSHSERCRSANRFGDGFDCICGVEDEYARGYVAGLRRAQELAKELSFEAYGEELHILAPELIQAIDAEAKK